MCTAPTIIIFMGLIYVSTKISVFSTDEEVDPVGSCVGMRGSRVQTIVNDLHGEKIDIVRWSEDIDVYTCNALAPAEIDSLEIDEDEKQIDVVVAPNQLSLAIGHKGQNVRLASKLIGYKINVVASEEEDLSIDEQLLYPLHPCRQTFEPKPQVYVVHGYNDFKFYVYPLFWLCVFFLYDTLCFLSPIHLAHQS